MAAIAAFLILFSVISSIISLSATYYGHLGYSGWITLSSGIITIAIALYSCHVVFKQQWDATPQNFQTVQVVQQPQTVQMVPVTETPGVQLTGATVVSAQPGTVPNQVFVSQGAPHGGIVNQAYQIVPAAAAQPAQNPQIQVTTAPQVITQYQMVPTAPSAPPTQTVYTVYPGAQLPQ